jgi:acetylglutamate kinase
MINKPLLTLVKIGGNIIDDPVILDKFLTNFAALEGFKILVHGGGKRATQMANSLGLTPQFYEGRRITDLGMLEVAVMTYAGWINKSITAQLQALNTNAIGFTGADGNLILSKKRDVTAVDFGFVGDIVSVNKQLLELLLQQNIVPVFSAITHNGAGQLLNTNADTIAATVAAELSSSFNVKLLYCFEKKGVLEDIADENSVIPQLTYNEYAALKENGTLHSGMLPKLENCFAALSHGVSNVSIGGTDLLNNPVIFTSIVHYE